MKARWVSKSLEESCLFSNGLWKGEKEPFVNVGVIRNTNFTKEGALDDSDIAYLDVEAKKFEKRRLQFGDIILEKSGGGPKQPVGRVVLFDKTEGDFSFSNFTAALRVRNPHELDYRYLHKFLHMIYVSGVTEGMQSNSTGIRNLDNAAYKAINITYPPLLEQQRIITILDKSFDGIATAKANTEKNLQNARALFENHLQSVFTQRGEGWVEKPFEELIESNIIGLTKSSREQGDDKSWRYVKMNNITRDNRFDFSVFTAVDATDKEILKFQLNDGDFLFNTRNSFELVGKSCIYEAESEEVVLFNNNIMRVRFVTGIDARFVLLAFSSKAVADALNSLKSGTTNVSAIYYKDLKSLSIPIPPIVDQKKIVIELDVLRTETQRLESIYKQKLAALDALRKSLLDQAFSGCL